MRRSLQTRLTLFYGTGIFAAGILALAIVDVTVAGIQSTTPTGLSVSITITGTGHGAAPQQLLIGSAIALAILVPVAVALGWFIAGRFLQPLRSITTTARAISAGNLHRRLDLGNPVMS